MATLAAKKKHPSALGERVAAERRQRAIMAMLRDEQAEHTEQLDERFKELREQGLIAPEPHKRARRTEDEQADGGGGGQSTAYDTMYRDLQLQPTNNAPSSEPPKQQNSVEEKPKVRQETPLLEFDEALAQFLRCCEEKGPTKSGIVRLDELLQKHLQPGLKKCTIAGPRCVLEQLVEMRSQFCKSKKARTMGPSFAHVTFLRLMATLFVSQSRFHPIVTPALAFAMELIRETRIHSISHCARQIFLCHQLLEWAGDESKPRYFPEVMAFLLGALQLCCESKVDGQGRAEPFPTMSFPVSHPHRQMLHVGADNEEAIQQLAKDKELGRLSISKIFGKTEDENEEDDENGEHVIRLRLLTIRSLFHTIGRYASLYGETPSGPMCTAFGAIFGRFHRLCERLPVVNYPSELRNEANNLTTKLASLIQQNARVTHLHKSEKRGPRPLKMLEPRFDERFDPERPNKSSSNKAKAREQSWARRSRKERRGALKVLRKDARELANAYADRQRKVRRERDEKTKRIMQTLEVQESEHKKLKAMKK